MCRYRERFGRATWSLVMLVAAAATLVSCSVRDGAPESYDRPWYSIANAVPKDEPKSRYGNPDSYVQFGKRYHVLKSSEGFVQEGVASWYGTKFHGERTSSGEEYDMYAMTAAHKTLPLPTYVEVLNKDNGRRAIVKVNDRGPFHDDRIIDLSYAAATRLGVVKTGTANVHIRALNPVANNAGTHVDSRVAKVDAGEDASPATAPGKVYVQVAAFSSEDKALRMLGQLRGANFSGTRIHVGNRQGKPLYRVRIGPLPSADVAKKLITQLQEIKQHNAKIVTYN